MSLYMFRALNAHLQLVVADRSPQTLVESDSTICCMYTVYPPEDENLRLETCRGT
jgi:hypothetical protein